MGNPTACAVAHLVETVGDDERADAENGCPCGPGIGDATAEANRREAAWKRRARVGVVSKSIALVALGGHNAQGSCVPGGGPSCTTFMSYTLRMPGVPRCNVSVMAL